LVALGLVGLVCLFVCWLVGYFSHTSWSNILTCGISFCSQCVIFSQKSTVQHKKSSCIGLLALAENSQGRVSLICYIYIISVIFSW
jgi:hypothetical protein